MNSRRSVIETELQALYERDGQLTPGAVVEAGTPANAPLHTEFDWDDAHAAHEHRLDQARRLIRSVKIVVIQMENGGPISHQVRRWVAASQAEIPDLAPGVYIATADLDPLSRQLLLRRMAREMAALRRKYTAYPEFWAEVDRMAGEGPAAASGG